jgi:cyclophilin family peptidyl-prolyl cis-trans isomerase
MKKSRFSLLVTALAAPALLAQAPAAPAAAGKTPIVVIKTSMGTIKAELTADKTPATVANFLQYTKDKFYDGLIFHRVINGFMIQGGGLDAKLGKKATRAPIKNEAKTGGKNLVGTLAMARTPDPDSASSQFFINVANNQPLDYRGDGASEIGYCVFGKVIEGMEVVDKIKAVPTGTQNGVPNVPLTPVVIESIRLEK